MKKVADKNTKKQVDSIKLTASLTTIDRKQSSGWFSVSDGSDGNDNHYDGNDGDNDDGCDCHNNCCACCYTLRLARRSLGKNEWRV